MTYTEKIGSVVEPGDVVLEIGTGTGDIAYSDVKKCRKVVGVDISGSMIDVAREKYACKGQERALQRSS